MCSKIHNKKAVKMICYISFFLVKLIYLKGVNEIIELFLGSAKNTWHGKIFLFKFIRIIISN